MRFLVLLFVASTLSAVEALVVTVGGATYPASQVTNAGATAKTGPLIYGGDGQIGKGEWAGKVVLLDRGTITFLEKLSRAQNYGALAVVVANNEPGSLSPTLSPGTAIITGVAVTQADGLLMRSKVGSVARVGPALPPPPPLVLPDPVGHKGETLVSDGEKYVFQKKDPDVNLGRGAGISTEAGSGEAVSFEVAATGTPPFRYQWSKDGVPIDGATSAVITIKTAKASDAGQYICLVTSATGSKMSNTYTLIVR